MTEQIRSDIICYTEMLQITYGLSITMHPTDAVLTASFSSLFRYNFHKAPLCLYCKQNKALRKRCVRTQKLIEAKCKNGSHRCFYGVCHAGIGCYVFPVMSGSRFLGYICVNGVKADTSLSSRRLKGIAKHAADLTKDQLEHLYEKSLLSVPDKALLETLILPLPHMLCQLHRESEALMEKSAHIPNLDLNMKVINFLYQNSTKQVTVDSIAEHVYFSRSFISHMFKKSNGMSISEYLHRIRLENAEALLATSDLTISAIATEVGFAMPITSQKYSSENTASLPAHTGRKKSHNAKTQIPNDRDLRFRFCAFFSLLVHLLNRIIFSVPLSCKLWVFPILFPYFPITFPIIFPLYPHNFTVSYIFLINSKYLHKKKREEERGNTRKLS